jgi:hypothetical protein
MTLKQFTRVVGDILALVLSAALIVATIIAINARVASAAYENHDGNSNLDKYVDETLDGSHPCEYVLARVEVLADGGEPCAGEEKPIKWIVPWIEIDEDCTQGTFWLVRFEVEEFAAEDSCIRAEVSL